MTSERANDMKNFYSWALATLTCVAVLGCDVPVTPDDGSGDTTVVPSEGTQPTKLPTATGTCPAMKTGTATFAGQSVQLWVGPEGKKGPLLMYWHATGMTSAEVQTGFSALIADVQKNGGVVASFASTNMQGMTTGNMVWYTGDFVTADEVVACSVAAGLVDPRRIHTSGYSAGGLQCGAMVYQRSGYLASALCMSGGIMMPGIYQLQDKAHVPAVVAAHGKAGSDVIVIDFSACSADLCADITKRGGFAVNCDDGGDHIMGMFGRMMTMGNVASTFFKDHPFGVNPYPYASGLPSVFPATCVITK